MAAADKNKGAPYSVLLAGATGLVGASLLDALLADARFQRVLAPTRRPLPAHPKLQGQALASAEREGAAEFGVVDGYLCALGTTLKAAGSRAAFRAVDVDLVLQLAKRARAAGARTAVVVSSVGADARSASFYLRCKAEMEAGLAALGFERTHLLQPSLLLGARDQRRPGEGLAQRLAPLYTPLMAGPLSRYRPVSAAAVAQRMVDAMFMTEPGVHRHCRQGAHWTVLSA